MGTLTHYDDCYKDPKHHLCALRRIRELEETIHDAKEKFIEEVGARCTQDTIASNIELQRNILAAVLRHLLDSRKNLMLPVNDLIKSALNAHPEWPETGDFLKDIPTWTAYENLRAVENERDEALAKVADLMLGCDFEKHGEEYRVLPVSLEAEYSPVLRDIVAERRRQDEKWGPQDHDPHYWLAILAEELGEAAKATIADTVNREQYRKELVQVAAVAVAAIENLDKQGS